jgi:septum formation topological specificity factor MinE
MEVHILCSSTKGAGAMAADKRKPDIPDEVIESLARTLLPAIRSYFESEEGQREFNEWKENKMQVQAAVEAVKP